MNRSLICVLAFCAASLLSGPLPAAAALTLPGMPVASPAAPGVAPAAAAAGLQAKIVSVNPRLSHHRGRQARVFVRNRGASASARGFLRLRTQAGRQPAFVTEAQPLPPIAPGGEVSRTFSLPRHLHAALSISRLEAVATIQGAETVLPPFSTDHTAPQHAVPQLPGTAMMPPPVQK